MKRCLQNAFLGFILALLAAAGAWAESSVWVVKGGKADVYLAGSCHVLRASDYPLPGEFEAVYARARQIVFEVPPGDLEGPEYAQKIMATAFYTDGTTLKNHLTPAVYAKTEKFCNDHNYPFEQYQSFRPWMLSMMLTMQEMSRLGVEPGYGVDQYFYQTAVKDGKIVTGLETADEQIGFLRLMEGSTGNDQVSETIDDLQQIEGQITDILNAWRDGREADIEAFTNRELKNYPQLYAALIVDRNKKWIGKIESLISSGHSSMVVVGIAHLAGPDSVVNMLRKRGYRVIKFQK